jgi:hypothetical protein
MPLAVYKPGRTRHRWLPRTFVTSGKAFVLSPGNPRSGSLVRESIHTLGYGTYLADARDRSPREMPLDSWLQRPLANATFYGELNADIAGANLVIQPETADKAEESFFIPLFRHNMVDYHPVNG